MRKWNKKKRTLRCRHELVLKTVGRWCGVWGIGNIAVAATYRILASKIARKIFWREMAYTRTSKSKRNQSNRRIKSFLNEAFRCLFASNVARFIWQTRWMRRELNAVDSPKLVFHKCNVCQSTVLRCARSCEDVWPLLGEHSMSHEYTNWERNSTKVQRVHIKCERFPHFLPDQQHYREQM